MHIEWNPNPLKTKVVLDERGQALFRAKIHIYVLEEEICGMVSHYMEDGPHFNLEKARGYAARLDDEDYINGRIDQTYNAFLEELEGEHCGDCTCVPCSCSKCFAEDMLGINTTKGLRKHEGSAVARTFRNLSETPEGLDQAIEALINYVPKADWDGWEEHAPRWKAEATRAAEWLKDYRNEHFAKKAPETPENTDQDEDETASS